MRRIVRIWKCEAVYCAHRQDFMISQPYKSQSCRTKAGSSTTNQCYTEANPILPCFHHPDLGTQRFRTRIFSEQRGIRQSARVLLCKIMPTAPYLRSMYPSACLSSGSSLSPLRFVLPKRKNKNQTISIRTHPQLYTK